jgi:transposase InsO family protein
VSKCSSNFKNVRILWEKKKMIKILHSNNGGEYFSFELNGILHQFTIPYNPKQNGSVKRENCTTMIEVA